MRHALRQDLASPRLLALLAASVAAAWAVPAAAQASGDKVWAEISGYTPSIETTARIDTASGSLGTVIHFEDDLNFDDRQTLPAVLVGVRLGGGFSITGEFFSLDRTATASLDHEITFRDVTFPVAASVTGEFNTDIYRLAVNYAVIQRANFSVGVAAGVHATDVEVAIEGEGRVGNSGLRFERRSQSLLAPMPTVGLFATANVLPASASVAASITSRWASASTTRSCSTRNSRRRTASTATSASGSDTATSSTASSPPASI